MVQVKRHFKASFRHKWQRTLKARSRILCGRIQHIPNAVTLAALDDALAGRDVHGPFDSVEALMADLNA